MITCRVNNELRQMASTREMVFNIPQLIVYISSFMTLEAGDVILSGRPPGWGPLLPGDQVKWKLRASASWLILSQRMNIFNLSLKYSEWYNLAYP